MKKNGVKNVAKNYKNGVKMYAENKDIDAHFAIKVKLGNEQI